jgi:hypothetical protein
VEGLFARGAAFMRKRRARVISRLYRDAGGGPEDCVFVAGMARSGTTWLAEIICSQLQCRLMFEPFASDRVPEYRGFEYQQYLRPNRDHPQFLAYFERVAAGRIRNPWIDRYVDRLRPRCRLIKAVRASLFLRWIHERFPDMPLIYLVRHPCANVLSYLKLDWPSDRDLSSIMAQPDLVEDHLAPYLSVIARATLPHQRHALLWCILNRVAIQQFRGGGLHRFSYEDLTRRPAETIPRLFASLGHHFDESVYERLRQPSRTARQGTSFDRRADAPPRWRKDLGEARIDDILEIVAAFDLDHLYDAEGSPTGRLEVDA